MGRMRVATFAAALLLCGCAGETYYKRPESAQLARVRLAGSGSSHDGILMTQHESASCELGKTGGIMGVVGGIGTTPIPLANVPAHVQETGNTQQMIGYSDAVGLAPIERTIAADRDFIFTIRRITPSWVSVGGRRTTWICTMTRQFTPRPGQQYEIVYSDTAYSEKADKPSCGARVNRLQPAADGTVQRLREPSFRNAPQTCSPGEGNVRAGR